MKKKSFNTTISPNLHLPLNATLYRAAKQYGKLFWRMLALVSIATLVAMLASCGNAVSDDSWQELEQDDIILGNKDASIVIIEYFDLQCPACAAAHSSISAAWRLIKDDTKLVMRHFPLTEIHSNAYLAAQYTEAARGQNAFYQMKTKMYQNQSLWSNESSPESIFVGFAEELKLDIAKLKSDLEKVKDGDRIERGIASGKKAGVTGTPTFFINGEKMNFPRTGEELYTTVQETKRNL